MAMERFKFEVTGTSPLLMHNPGGMKAPDGGGKATAKAAVPDPATEARAGLYIDDAGRLYGPASGFRGAMVIAAKGRKSGKVGTGTVVKSAVFVPLDAERVFLFDPRSGKPLTDRDYVIDSRRAVLPNGSGVVRSRPRFEHWGCVVELEIDTDFMAVELAAELLSIGGRVAGFLDFGPRSGGSFGRYTSKLMTGKQRSGRRAA